MIPVDCLQRGDTAWKWTKPVLTHSSPQGQHELFIQGPCLRGSLPPVAVSVDGRAGDGPAGLVLLPLPPALSHHLHELFNHFSDGGPQGAPDPFPSCPLPSPLSCTHFVGQSLMYRTMYSAKLVESS